METIKSCVWTPRHPSSHTTVECPKSVKVQQHNTRATDVTSASRKKRERAVWRVRSELVGRAERGEGRTVEPPLPPLCRSSCCTRGLVQQFEKAGKRGHGACGRERCERETARPGMALDRARGGERGLPQRVARGGGRPHSCPQSRASGRSARAARSPAATAPPTRGRPSPARPRPWRG